MWENGEFSHKNIKKPRKREINYLQEFPEGMDVANLEAVLEAMVTEMQKKNPNYYLIRKNMDITFAGQCFSMKTRFVNVFCFLICVTYIIGYHVQRGLFVL